MARCARLAFVIGLVVCLSPVAGSAAPITYGPEVSTDLFLIHPTGGQAWTEYWSYRDALFHAHGEENLAPGWFGYPGEFDSGARDDILMYQPSTGGWKVRTSTGTGWNVSSGSGFAHDAAVFIGRFDADARDDALLYTGSQVIVESSNGTGGWRVASTTPISSGWQITPGRFNNDGSTDLFLYSSARKIGVVEFSNGRGGWREGPLVSFPSGVTVTPGTFFANGLTGLFLYNATTGDSWVRRADGSGGWAERAWPTMSTGWTVYPGLFNLDTFTDVFLYRPGAGSVTWVLTSDGFGGWRTHRSNAFSNGFAFYPGSFDFHDSTSPYPVGQGSPLTDLFAYRASTGTAFIEWARGDGTFKAKALPQFSPGWSIVVGRFAG